MDLVLNDLLILSQHACLRQYVKLYMVSRHVFKRGSNATKC